MTNQIDARRWMAVVLVMILSHLVDESSAYKLFESTFDPWTSQYKMFSESDMLNARKAAHDMFTFGYDNYMRYAYPLDELDPINCLGRGPDYANPYVCVLKLLQGQDWLIFRSNININDVLGDYSLTLVDALDTLAVCFLAL